MAFTYMKEHTVFNLILLKYGAQLKLEGRKLYSISEIDASAC